MFAYYYLSKIVILALILISCAVVSAFWLLRRRWLGRYKALEQELADCQASHFQKLYGFFHRIVAHEYGKGLEYIRNKGAETYEGLGKEQLALRDKQSGIIAKSQEMELHGINIQNVFALQPDKLKKELLNIRQLVENVLKELFPYAESQGVTLRPDLVDIEPLILDLDLTVLAIRNLVHNAIKYSDHGKVVEISLTQEGEESQAGKAVIITVKDYGRGIREEDKERLFEVNMRGDGLIETGSGLGLYCARKAARLQDGDVILESSSPGQGSVFKISLPFATTTEVVKEDIRKPRQRSWTVWRWGLMGIVLLGLAVLMFYLFFKPPQKVAIGSYHERYVSALDDKSGWTLRQKEGQPDKCEKFTLIRRSDKVALLTCNNRFVTAPRWPNERPVTPQHDKQLQLWQDSRLSDCGLFDVEDQPDDPKRPGDLVAFRTCSGMYVTAGNETWPGEMQWAVVAETDKLNAWETFTLEPQR